MTDNAFHDAQALYDAALPDDEPETTGIVEYVRDMAQVDWDTAEPADDDMAPVGIILERVLNMVKSRHLDVETGDTHTLSDRQATAAIWIDGHEYSLTLNRESDL